jgi:hypothetical protein
MKQSLSQLRQKGVASFSLDRLGSNRRFFFNPRRIYFLNISHPKGYQLTQRPLKPDQGSSRNIYFMDRRSRLID